MKIRTYEQDGALVAEVAVPLPDDATTIDPETGEEVPHPDAGKEFDADGRPYNLRAWRLPADTEKEDAKQHVQEALDAEQANEQEQESAAWENL